MNSKKLNKLWILVMSLSFLSPSMLWAESKIKVVATTTTLASLATEIAGDRIRVFAIASPRQNLHHYGPTPKDVLKVKEADVLVHQGLDLEVWREPLLDAAGNPHFMGESPYRIDASKGIELLEVPLSISRAQGDIHLFGNPHYLGDPENYKVIAGTIAQGLISIDPAHADLYKSNEARFSARIDEKMAEWKMRMAAFRGSSILTYHKSWVYFAERFGLKIVGEVEPKPGIPPTAKHLADLMQIMKGKKVKVVIREPFEESGSPEKIALETGATVVTLSQAVGEPKEAKDVFLLMDQNIQRLEDALKKSGGKL